MSILRAAAAVALALPGATVTAAPPALFMAEFTWSCPTPGWLAGATDAERKAHGCIQYFIKPQPVVVLDADDPPLAFVCAETRGEWLLGGQQRMARMAICGYALQTSLTDATGKQLDAPALRKMAAQSSFADVHRLPTIRY